MLIDNTTLYEKNHSIIVNEYQNQFFYFFDYDTRNYEINMEFQHFHPFYEILIPLSPGVDHLIEGRHLHLQINDIVLLAPSILHKSIYAKGEVSKRIIISFMYPDNLFNLPDIYESILSVFHMPTPVYRFNIEQRKQLFSILNKIFEYSRTSACDDTAVSNFHIHTIFQEFLYQLYEMSKDNIYKNESSFSPIEEKVYEITSYIHSNYKEALSLESLSQQFYISPGYLSHQFKNITHFNLIHYIQITRIRNIQYRLISTNEKISDIAFSCGFTSFSQFNRIFQKITQQSPSEYRKTGILPH